MTNFKINISEKDIQKIEKFKQIVNDFNNSLKEFYNIENDERYYQIVVLSDNEIKRIAYSGNDAWENTEDNAVRIFNTDCKIGLTSFVGHRGFVPLEVELTKMNDD